MLLEITLRTSAGRVNVFTADGLPFNRQSAVMIATPTHEIALPAQAGILDDNPAHAVDTLLVSSLGLNTEDLLNDVIKTAVHNFNALPQQERTLFRRSEITDTATEIFKNFKNGHTNAAQTVMAVRAHESVLFGTETESSVTVLLDKHLTSTPEMREEINKTADLLETVRAVLVPIVQLNLQVDNVQNVPNLSVDEFTGVLDAVSDDKPVASSPEIKTTTMPAATPEMQSTTPVVLEEPKTEAHPVAEPVSPVADEMDALDMGVDILTDTAAEVRTAPRARVDNTDTFDPKPAGTRIKRAIADDLMLPELTKPVAGNSSQPDLFAAAKPDNAEDEVIDLDFDAVDFENPVFDDQDLGR